MTKLIALEKTIEKIESGEYRYDWWSPNHCNCGLVARTLLNGQAAIDNDYLKVWNDFPNDDIPAGFWGMFEYSQNKCSTTGIALPKVFQVLKETGFTVQELKELESCGGNKKQVLSYLRAWVQILKEQQFLSHPPITTNLDKLKTTYVVLTGMEEKELVTTN